MPENTVSITRPGRWGNPYKGENCVQKFKDCVLNNSMVYLYSNSSDAEKHYKHFKWISENIAMLINKDIACFCKSHDICHGDVLINMINEYKISINENGRLQG
jgi:5'(3')-deoxyribonucleotidase